MVRSSALRKDAFSWIVGLSLWLTLLPISSYGHPLENRNGASGVAKDGTISFGRVDFSLNIEENGYSLRIPFKARFSLDGLQLSLNGRSLKHPVLFNLSSFSRWETSENGKEAVLIIDLDELKLEGEELLEVMFRTWKHHGFCRFKLNTHIRPLGAYLFKHHRRFYPKTTAEITQVIPPEPVTTSRSITFHFRSNIGKTLFFYSLDGSRWKRGVSPLSFNALKPGRHHFRVRALSPRMRLGRVAHYQWKIVEEGVSLAITGIEPPDAMNNSDTMKIYFKSSSKMKTKCQLDNGSEADCSSPIAYSGLGEGAHQVMILGYQKGVQAAKVSHTWVTDRTAPLVQWQNTPELRTNRDSALFSMSSNEEVRWQCFLDEAATPCDSTMALTELNEGTHNVRVKAIDHAGNTSLPLSYSWVVDRTSPIVTIQNTDPAQSPTNSTKLSLSFVTSERASVSCFLNGILVRENCESPAVFNGLPDGDYEAKLIATDEVGNIGVPVTHKWVVDTRAPILGLSMTFPKTLPTNENRASFEIVADEQSQIHTVLDGVEVPNSGQAAEVYNLSEGAHTFEVFGVDSSGNESTHAKISWSVDLTAPTLRLGTVSPDSNPTEERSITVEFSSDEPGTFTCELNGSGSTACESPFIANGLMDGEHRLVIQAKDLAGNVSSPLTYDWRIFSYATVQIDAQVPAGVLTNSGSMVFSFSSPNASRFICELDGGALVPCTSPHTISGLANGQHQFRVSAINALGGIGGSDTRIWSVDRQVPVLLIQSVSPSQYPTSQTSLTAQFTTSELASVVCAVDGSSQTCTSPFTVSGLTEGSHILVLTATDLAGNTGQSISHSWSIDLVAPIVSITSRDPVNSVTNRSEVSFNFSSNETGTRFYCSLDQSSFQSCTSPVSYTDLSSGTHTFSVYGSDTAGLHSTIVSSQWIVDQVPPVVSLTHITPSESVTASRTIEFQFSSNESNVSYNCFLDSGIPMPCTSPISYNFFAGDDGFHTFQVSATDAVGNTGLPVVYRWQIDTMGPSVVFNSIVPSSSVITSRDLSASFTLSEPGNAFCSLDGSAYALCFSPVQFTQLSDGAHTLSVYAEDSLGNQGAISPYSWTVDATPPVVTIVSITPSFSPTSNTSLTVSFTANKPVSQFLCALDGGNEVACPSPYTVSGLTAGSHRLSIVAVDTGGERSLPESYSWTVDLSPLTISNVSVSNITATSAVVTWTTSVPAYSQVLYGVGSPSQSTQMSTTLVTNHSVLLIDLARFSFYSVQGRSFDADGREVTSSVITFRTLR